MPIYTEKTYRATFAAGDTLLGLDFYADNKDLARDHAGTVARDEGYTVVKVVRIYSGAPLFDAGSFYPVRF